MDSNYHQPEDIIPPPPNNLDLLDSEDRNDQFTVVMDYGNMYDKTW